MGWVVKLEEVIDGKVVHRSKVATLDSPTSLESLDDLGLRLADAKTLLARIQAQMVTRQIEHDAEDEVMPLNAQQINWLLDGYDINLMKGHKKLCYESLF